MASYQPIQPTSTQTNRSSFDHGPGGPGAASGLDQPKQRTQGKRARRTRQVVQACPHCRQSKAKCDGARPRCSNCVVKNQPCGYLGKTGQTRQAAMMTRLETLETLVKSLQTRPPEDAEQLVHRLRAAEGTESLPKLVAEAVNSDDGASDRTNASVPGPMSGASSQVVGPDLDLSSASQSSVVPGKVLATNGVSSKRPMERQTPVIVEIVLPDRSLLARAVEAFFSSSLQPFHVFSSDEVARFLSLVYSEPGSPQQTGYTALACLAAIAAVGARYPRAALDKDTPQTLYNVARYHFETVVEAKPLDAIKCCVLLAMYNFMAHSTAALIYVECGLNIARRQGLYVRDPRDTTLTTGCWTKYRKAWRILLCLSSWVPFTAGFNEDHDDPISRIPLIDTDIGPQVDDADSESPIPEQMRRHMLMFPVLQSEMTKISLLKADLLRSRLARPVIDIATMQAANHDLENWYSQIPDVMLLHNVGKPSYREGVQTCICYIHLLHLDTIILLARRAISEFVRSYGFRNPCEIPWTGLDQALVSQVAQGVLAASHSSRILALLRQVGQARELSWLIMNQAHAACMILIHSTAQKQLHQLPEPLWAENLDQAETCLSVLEACGLADPLAAQLWEQLHTFYSAIAKQPPTTLPQLDVELPSVMWNENAHLLTTPRGSDRHRLKLPARLLKLLSQPFDDICDKRAKIYGAPDKDDLQGIILEDKSRAVSSSSRQEQPAAPQKLEDWNFASSLPFRIDSQRKLKGLGLEAAPASEGWAQTEGSTPPQARAEGSDAAKKRKAPPSS